MRVGLQPIKTTVVGGLIFLIPLGIVILIFGKILLFMGKIAEPISAVVPIESFAGIAVLDLLTLMVTLLLCFLAGLVARSALGGKVTEAVEAKIYTLFPRYAFVKSMTMSITGSEDESTLKPVLAKFDDLSQIAFEVDRHEDDLVTVYLPGSPDPWSGSLVHLTKDRIEALDTDFAAVIKGLRTVGKGLSEPVRKTLG